MTNLKLFLLSISSALVQVVCWESKLISVDLDPPWIFPAGALCPSFFFFFFLPLSLRHSLDISLFPFPGPLELLGFAIIFSSSICPREPTLKWLCLHR